MAASLNCLKVRFSSVFLNFLRPNVSYALSDQNWKWQRTISSNSTQANENKTEENANDEKFESQDEIKEKILNASLTFVHEHGWSVKSLAEGAKSVGYPVTAHGIFPNGGVELAHYFYSKSNDDHVKILQSLSSEKIKKSEFITNAVEQRIRMIIPYKKQWPQAIGLMSLPQNAGQALSNLSTLVDNIWFYAGDKSTDFNWYTKRISLAGVYKTTELVFLQDNSQDFEQTSRFLRKQIENVEFLGKFIRGVTMSNEVARGSFLTLKNILGVQDSNR